MVKIQGFSAKGVKSVAVSLPKKYEVKVNMNLLSQAIYVYQDRAHVGTSKTKTRSEVVATGAKVYRQKGTGGARHGDKKAPIYVGGGKAHGPKGIKRTLKLSKNLRNKALAMALTLKTEMGKIVVVDKINTIKKTKQAGDLIKKIKKELGIKKFVKTLVSLADANGALYKNFRNVRQVAIFPFSKLNAYQVYTSSLVIVDKEAFNEKPVVKNEARKTSEKKVTVAKKIEKTKKAKKSKTVKK